MHHIIFISGLFVLPQIQGCFCVTFCRIKEQGASKMWRIKSLPASSECLPHEPMVLALRNTYIPPEIKLELILLFDRDVKAAQAYTQSLEVAQRLGLATTWTKDDVKNFFGRLKTQWMVHCCCARGSPVCWHHCHFGLCGECGRRKSAQSIHPRHTR